MLPQTSGYGRPASMTFSSRQRHTISALRWPLRIVTPGRCPPPLTVAADVLDQCSLPLRRASSQGF